MYIYIQSQPSCKNDVVVMSLPKIAEGWKECCPIDDCT